MPPIGTTQANRACRTKGIKMAQYRWSVLEDGEQIATGFGSAAAADIWASEMLASQGEEIGAITIVPVLFTN